MPKSNGGKSESQKRYWYKNRDKLLERSRERTQRLKRAVYQFYGGNCKCCGEFRPSMLTIDHVNNDGWKDRCGRGGSSHRIYAKIIKEGFPDTYQILCMNCNFSKKMNGGECVHKKEPVEYTWIQSPFRTYQEAGQPDSTTPQNAG